MIRNSTAEFLIFTGQAGEKSIEARYEDGTVWLTQKLIAELFEVKVPTINEHLRKYRIMQDRLFESDFDKIVKQIKTDTKKGRKE